MAVGGPLGAIGGADCGAVLSWWYLAANTHTGADTQTHTHTLACVSPGPGRVRLCARVRSLPPAAAVCGWPVAQKPAPASLAPSLAPGLPNPSLLLLSGGCSGAVCGWMRECVFGFQTNFLEFLPLLCVSPHVTSPAVAEAAAAAAAAPGIRLEPERGRSLSPARYTLSSGASGSLKPGASG